MKSKIFIWIIALCLLSSFVLAADSDAMHWWKFDTGHYMLDHINGLNITTTNAAMNTSTYAFGNASIDIGAASNSETLNSAIGQDTDLSLTGWFWIDESASASPFSVYPVRLQEAANNERTFLYFANGNVSLQSNCVVGGDSYSRGQSNFTHDEWHHFAIVADVTTDTLNFYFDGSLVKTTSCTQHSSTLTSARFMYSYDSDGIMLDEVTIWNKTLSADDIKNLNNSGTTQVDDTLNITNVVPSSDSEQVKNTTIDFNVSVTSSYNYSCYLKINSTINGTFTGENGTLLNHSITHRMTNIGEYNWQWSCNNTNGTSESSILRTLKLVPLTVDNCTDYSTRAINITVRRDDTNTLVNTSIGAYFFVTIPGQTVSQRVNLTWINTSNAGVCIDPAGANYSAYAQIEYGGNTWASNVYATETHYLVNYTLDNQTDLLDLYLTPNGTSVTFTVTDENDNDVSEVYIHILRYDFDTNSHLVTEIIRTDESGEALGNIVQTDQWYKFLLVYNQNIVLETDPVKITGTERNFRINLQTDFFDFFTTLDGVQTSLTFTNSTKNFAYTFLNPTGTSVTACLEVIQRSPITDYPINTTCVTSTAGTILINIGNDVDGNLYLATGTIQVNPIEITDIVDVSFAGGYKKYGKDGIFASLFVRTSLSMIGIWNPLVALIMLVLADIAMIMMGLYHMSWTTLIFYIVLAGITIYRVNRK